MSRNGNPEVHDKCRFNLMRNCQLFFSFLNCVTNYHKLDGLKQQKSVLSKFEGWKFEIKMLAGPMLSLKAAGGSPSWPPPNVDGSSKSSAPQLQHFNPCLNRQWSSSLMCFSVFSLLLLMVLVIGRRTRPKQL